MRLVNNFGSHALFGIAILFQDGSTALRLAASGGHKEVAELLMDKGADPKATNKVFFCKRLKQNVNFFTY